MPRNRKSTGVAYDPKLLEVAVKLVADGQPLRKVAKDHGIPKSTLNRWVNEPPAKIGSGGRTVLSNSEELVIVSALEYIGQCGYPKGRDEVKNMVKSYLDSIGRKNPFKDNRPGEDWMLLFEKRHANAIKRRKPEILTTARAEGLSDNVVNKFFDMYEGLLTEHNLHNAPERLFNLDETGFNTDRTGGAVYVQKECKDAYMMAPNAGKTTFTVLFCISANGTYLPPFVVYKAKHIYESWKTGGVEGAKYDCSESGWMMDYNFESWFINVFVNHVKDLEKPVLLTFDGHNSHLTYNTVRAGIDNGILLLCLPPNTSHALQPLDVGVFRAVKVEWRKILSDWYNESRMQNVDKAVFPILLKRLWQRLRPANAVNAFRGSGLYPSDRTAVRHRIVVPDNHSSASESSAPLTPRKLMRKAILNSITPEQSAETQEALLQKKQKRRRVQDKHGEHLSTEPVARRLLLEQEAREAKKAGIRQPSTSGYVAPSKTKKKVDADVSSSDDDASDDDGSDDDGSDSDTTDKTVDLRLLEENKTHVMVNYEGTYFPGIVLQVGKTHVQLSCMCKCGTGWSWPSKKDLHEYPHIDVIKIIEPPKLMNTRGQCSVPELNKFWN